MQLFNAQKIIDAAAFPVDAQPSWARIYDHEEDATDAWIEAVDPEAERGEVVTLFCRFEERESGDGHFYNAPAIIMGASVEGDDYTHYLTREEFFAQIGAEYEGIFDDALDNVGREAAL